MSQPRLVPVGFDPFAGGALVSAVPSTESQREIWTAARLGNDASLAFNESNSLALHGPLDPAALRHSLHDLVARHESLRAAFSADGLMMCVAEPGPVELPLHDLSALPAEGRDEALDRLLAEEVETPFDLERGPLFRARLARRGPEEHRLVFTGHHIVLDGWSTGVLVADWARLYSARRAGRAPALPPAEPFTAYALDLARERTGLEAHEAYWLRQFEGQVPVLALPSDRPRPAFKTFAARRLDVVLEPGLVQQVKRAGAREGASLFATLLAAFDALLHRLNGQADLVVGVPAAGQAQSGRRGMVGHCVNTLPLRCRLDGAEPFRDLLKRVRGGLLDAFEHQELTFGALLKKLPIPRDPSRQPLVSVLFNLDQKLPAEALAFEGLEASFATTPRRFESFDLFVNALDGPAGLSLEVQYNTDLFDGSTVRRWLCAWERLLRSAAADPATPLRDLELLTDDERADFARWNATAAPGAGDRLLHELLAEQARRRPADVAAVCGDQQLTYGELDRRAERLARRLRRGGVGAGTLVGLLVERSLDMLVGLWGILRAGGAYVPLDPAYPAERLAFMASDSGMPVLVTQGRLRGRLQVALEVAVDEEAEPEDEQAEPLDRAPGATPESPAYVIYTSGSTGKPKGVAVPHRAVVNFMSSMAREPGLRADDVLVAVTTLSFDIAGLELHLPLLVGARVVLADADTVSSGVALRDLLERSGGTVLQATPATWRLLLGAGFEPRPGFKALCGGEALPRDLAEELLGRVGALFNMYGPTETTIWSACARLEAPLGTIVIGRPIANTQVHVLDERLRQVPVGVVGELYIGGDGVALGYLNRPELTAERFLPDPFSPGRPEARVYRTGDLARWLPDGQLECLGRVDQQVKVRGFRIELGEIEAALAAHAGVRRAAVEAREVRPGDVRLVAYLVSEGAPPDDEALRVHLRRTLPEYMVPQHFVPLRELPLTPNGKLDRRALPMPEVAQAAAGYAEPATPAERLVAALWQEALGVGRVGRDDSFFALGGHSLLAAQVLARLNREHGLALPFRAVFEAPTLRRFAARLEGPAGEGAAAPAERMPRRAGDGPARVTIMQERILLLEELDPERRLVHNLPSAFRLEGPLDVRALEASLDAVVARHQALRTTFKREGQGLVQVVGPPDPVRLAVEDLTGLPPEEREPALRRVLDEERGRPFDLERGPLFWARLFRLGPDHHVLFSLRHNTVWDGWSFDVFRRDLAALYAHHAQGKPLSLPDLPVSYSDFAEWHAGWLAGPDCQRQLAWWRERLAGGLEPLALPVDRPRGAQRGHAAADEWFELPRAEVEALTELGRSTGATLYMTLFAALCVLLHRYTGQADLLVATPVRNRARPEVEDLIGLFTNTLPIRARVDPGLGFEALLAATRDTVLEAFSHQEAPFELVSRDAPAPRLMFSMQEVRHRATALGEARLTLPHLVPAGAALELNLWLLETHQGLTGALNYSTDLFDRATMVRFLAHFRQLLASIRESPRLPVGRLAVVDAAERAQLRALSAGGPAPAPERLERVALAAAGREPAAPAVLRPWGAVSHGQLEARVRRGAAWLRAQAGGAPRVAVALADPVERLVAALSVVSAGGVAVQLDLREPRPALARQLAGSGARLLWTTPELGRALGDGLALVPAELPPLPDGETPAPAPLTDGELAGALFVPGPSGDSRLVELRHAALAAALSGARAHLGLGPETVALLTPDSGLLESLLPLAAGGRLVPAEAETCRDGGRLAALLEEQDITFLAAPPATWQRLLDAGWAGRAGLTGLVTALPPRDLAAALAQRLRALWSAHGCAEAGEWCALQRVSGDEGWRIGPPLPGVTLHVLDEQLEPCAVGVPGELCVGGAGLAAVGPAVSFAQGPDGPLYRTGERARRHEDGRVEPLGRLDERVFVDGLRVEPAGVAAALASHPAVHECAVLAREDAQGGAHLVACLARADGSATEEALRDLLAQRFPAAAVPRRFLAVAALPRRAYGALDRRALAELCQAAEVEAGYVAPRTPAEIALAELVAQVLGRERVGVSDDFFALGGRSLQAARLAARIAESFGAKLSIAAIMTHSTVARLAELVANPDSQGATHGLFLIRPGTPGSAVFVMPDLVGLFGNARLLAAALGSAPPVYSIMLPERDGAPYTFATIEELARYCVERIEAGHPRGTCHLVGYSFGGKLAYELARQLRAAGRRVGMLALIDTQATVRPPRSLGRLLREAEVLLSEGLYLAWHDLTSGHWRRSAKGALRRLRRRLGQLSDRHVIDEQVGELQLAGLPDIYADVARVHLAAMRRYREQPFAGRVTLVRARRLNVVSTRSRDLGWGHLAAGVDVRIVPGHHWNLLEPPALGALATFLTDAIAAAEAG